MNDIVHCLGHVGRVRVLVLGVVRNKTSVDQRLDTLPGFLCVIPIAPYAGQA